MRVTVFQPPYPQSSKLEDSNACVEWIYNKINAIPANSTDLILLPEYANAPAVEENVERNSVQFCHTLSVQAVRIGAYVVAGVAVEDNNSLRNRGIIYAPDGTLAGSYDKTHLTAVEAQNFGITPGSKPSVFEIAGVRVGFATCFDIYFPEYIQMLAAQNIDLLLCPSYQRSETAKRIETISSCRAIDSGAYIVRSSYSLDTPGVGGHSLIAAPDGTILVDAGENPGVIAANIDLSKKFTKPASHGQPSVEYRELIQNHRRQQLYMPNYRRILELNERSFPRICAHRGLSIACPENTLPAFAAAISTGADEIELDLWMSKDGEAVVCHDPDLSRTTDRTGNISELTWEEISKADAGIRYGEQWAGVRIPRFEEVVELVDSRIGINIHMKEPGPDGILVKFVCDILRDKGLLETCYIAGDEDVLKAVLEYAPEVNRDSLAGQDIPDQMIDYAVQYGCTRVQFYRNFEPRHAQRARDLGIICNLFYSNEPAEAREFIKMGIDVVLTDCAHQVTREAVRQQ